MPSCSGTEFEVIRQYLTLRDEIESEDDSYYAIASDQKLPQFSASFLGGGASAGGVAVGGSDTESTSSSLPPNTFPAMETPTGEPWPVNFLLSAGADPLPTTTLTPTPVFSLEPAHTARSPGKQTTSYVFLGSGCTVTETSPQGGGGGGGAGVVVPFPEEPLPSPDLYDLDGDKQNSIAAASFYGKEAGSFYNSDKQHTTTTTTPPFYEKAAGNCFAGSKVEIKTERVDDFPEMNGSLDHRDYHHQSNNNHLEHHHHHHLNGHNGPYHQPQHSILEVAGMLQEDREDLTTFMIQSLREEIIRDCKEMGVSPDPREWNERDTLTWVNSVLRKDLLPGCPLPGGDDASVQALSVPGEVLCQLSLQEFQSCLPEAGNALYQRLEIWRMAMDITPEPAPPPPQQQQWYPSKHPHHPQYQHPHPPTTPTTTTTTTINSNFAYGTPPPRPMGDYRNGGAGAAPMAPSTSPAPSTDSSCSSLSHSSSSSSPPSLVGGGGGGGGEGRVHYPHVNGTNYSLASTHETMEEEVVFGVSASARSAIAASAASSRRKTTISSQPPPPPPQPSHLPTTTPAHPRGPRVGGKQTIHLWQFLRELLDNSDHYHDCIKWTDRARGVFKIEDSSKVARLWGRRKNRPAMNYDKLSRSVRQYYKKGIIKKTQQSKRLVYQFCQPYL